MARFRTPTGGATEEPIRMEATTLFYRGWRRVMPTAKDGKICYIEMPTKDVQTSAGFYQRAFGWTIRTRGDGAIAFDDTTGEVSGAFVLGRPPAATPGLMVYIMVDSVADAMKKVEANGGEIVQPIGGDPGEITARFRDPGGNV
ncbi:MAG: VOC family protein, partial [Acidobacteriaceae bacterium]